jgi:hypothetical protein
VAGAITDLGATVDRTERRRAEQRARLQAAEVEAFAHYGVDATSEPLVLATRR